MSRRKITTFLGFSDQAEEVATLYGSLFEDSWIDRITPGPDGKPMLVEFILAGIPFMALNGGPHFQLNEAASLYVNCADQSEVDRIWGKHSAGGTESQCGWLKNWYGLSWQIIPHALPSLLADPSRAGHVMQALM